MEVRDQKGLCLEAVYRALTAWDRKQRRCSNTERLQNISDAVFSLVRHGVYPSERKLRDLGYVIASDLRREDVKQLLSTLQDIYEDLRK